MSTETSSKPFNRSTNLPLKNFCPNIPFGLSSIVPLSPSSLFRANSNNLSNCSASHCFLSIDNRKRLDYLFCSPMCLIHFLSIYFYSSYCWRPMSERLWVDFWKSAVWIYLFLQAIYIAPLQFNTTQRRSLHSTDTVSEFHAEAPHATLSEGLAQGSCVAAREGVEPMTLRTKGVDSTKEPPRPTNAQLHYIIVTTSYTNSSFPISGLYYYTCV